MTPAAPERKNLAAEQPLKGENPRADLIRELERIPQDFYGRVEIVYQNGQPGLIHVTSTINFKKPNGPKTLGEDNDRYTRNR